MRLIDTSSHEIIEYNPPNIPRYAILSHTWGHDEYIFADRLDRNRQNSAGFKKISVCCALAASEGWQYLWVDTCCIDKTSSAELTESINSMYKWYQESQVCYVYLSDFSLGKELSVNGIYQFGNARLQWAFSSSRWFKRGWTLQELLAPNNVVFYDQDWVEIGSKAYLEAEISRICCINVEHLIDPIGASIATKMSWASSRETSREEDMAYSLLGLFGINMPLIYGEGQNAFFRLQSEIIRVSDDESIFAWKDDRLYYSGMFARDTKAFRASNDIVPIRLEGLSRPPYNMTNKGLAIELEVRRMNNQDDQACEYVVTALACAKSTNRDAPVKLFLRTINGSSLRYRCMEIDFDEKYLSRLQFKPEELMKMTFHISNQYRHSPLGVTPKKIEQWLPTRVNLTRIARDVFRLKHSASMHGCETLSDGSHAFPSFQRPSGFDFTSSSVLERSMKFKSSGGIHFLLTWLDSGTFSFFDDPTPKLGPPSSIRMSIGLEKSVERAALKPYDNKSYPCYGDFLWVSTRRELVGKLLRQVIEIDLTSTNRSRLLNNSTHNDPAGRTPDLVRENARLVIATSLPP